MKYLSLIFLLLVLTSCSNDKIAPQDVSSEQIQLLQGEVTKLKIENANLKEENNFLRAGGDPTTISSSFGSDTDTGKTFTEGSLASCMQQAFDEYVRQGSEKCTALGYSSGDILANKCQLDTPIITNLKTTRTLAEGECKNLYK